MRLCLGELYHYTSFFELSWIKHYMNEWMNEWKSWKALDVYVRSPRILRASWRSLGMMVIRFAWSAQRLVSSKRPTRYASEASCSAPTAVDWKRISGLIPLAISLTRREKGSFRMSNSVDFWKRRISLRATVPGRKRCAARIFPLTGIVFPVDLEAGTIRTVLATTCLRAVCLVRAMFQKRKDVES